MAKFSMNKFIFNIYETLLIDSLYKINNNSIIMSTMSKDT